MTAAVVIGVGNPFRHDDGIGPTAAELVGQAAPEVDVFELDGEAVGLMTAWADRQVAIVIDAMRAGGAAGSIHRVEVGVDPLPDWAPQGSTHGAGLAEAVALGRALDLLPGQLIVYGVEPADVSDGQGLSPAVQHALPELVDRIVAEVSSRCA